MIILITKVLLHTVIDWMRTEDEGEDGRNINHHGKTITVGGKQDAVAADIEGVRLIDITTLLVSFNNQLSFYLQGSQQSSSLQESNMNPGGNIKLRRPFTGRSSRIDYANMTQVLLQRNNSPKSLF